MAAPALHAQARERTSVAFGITTQYIARDDIERLLHQPGIGFVMSGEWRTGNFGVVGEGTVGRFFGKRVTISLGPGVDTTLRIPDPSIYTVGFAARAHMGGLYAGPGVGVYSSDSDLEDEISPTLTAGLRIRRIELGVRFKAGGLKFLEVRALLHVRTQ